jgi:DNA-binding transcriptional MerR regulator
MSDEHFSIQELCDLSGLTRRTVHFYIQQEIIPPPIGSGLGAHYQKSHLVRLQLIPLLRSQGYRLDDIRQKYKSASPGELETMLQSLSANQAQSLPAPNPPVVKKLAQGKTYLHYLLPHGIILIVPSELNADGRAALAQVLVAFGN